MFPPPPDFPLPFLLTHALAHPRPVPLAVARFLLGPLLDEPGLDQHTLIVRADGDITLPPITWIRLLLRARELAEGTAALDNRPPPHAH